MWTIIAWILVVVLIVMLFVAFNETASKEELASSLKEDNQKLKKEKLQLEIQLNKKEVSSCSASRQSERIVYKDRIVEKPVEKIVYRDKIVEKEVKVPVEKIIYVEKDKTDDSQVCLEDIREQGDRIIENAHYTAERIIREAKDKLEDAKKEAETIRRDAKTGADAIIQVARKQKEEADRVFNLSYLKEKEESLELENELLRKQKADLDEYAESTIKKAHIERSIILGNVNLEEYLSSLCAYDISNMNILRVDNMFNADSEIESLKLSLKKNKLEQKRFKNEHNGLSCYMPSDNASAYLCHGTLYLGTITLDVLCDNIILNAKKDSIEKSIDKLARAVNLCENNLFVYGKYLSSCAFYEESYIKLRIEELKLVYNIHLLNERKKEEQRILKEQQREEAAAQREFERELKKAQKDKDKAEEALAKARAEAEKEKENTEKFAKLQEQIASLQSALEEAQQRSERVMSMAQQTRQGWVYIISNIGSFGDNVYKIGMTRRLDPMERVNELGDASVPFPFDVHAMIFSEDAPALETALHQAFENKKTNLINGKKEFFNVSLNEIKDKVKELGYEVTFDEQASAPQYRDTLYARKNL